MHASTASSTIAINPQPLIFGGRGESSCGWFSSSQELRDGLAVRELSDGELFALWQQLRGGAGGGQGMGMLALGN